MSSGLQNLNHDCPFLVLEFWGDWLACLCAYLVPLSRVVPSSCSHLSNSRQAEVVRTENSLLNQENSPLIQNLLVRGPDWIKTFLKSLAVKSRKRSGCSFKLNQGFLLFLFQGTLIIPNLSSVLFEKGQWKCPHEFHPDNFLNENREFVKPEAFLPFSTGETRVDLVADGN